MKYNFQERINKLLSFDKIRLYKIIEIIEYSIIFFILHRLIFKMKQKN